MRKRDANRSRMVLGGGMALIAIPVLLAGCASLPGLGGKKPPASVASHISAAQSGNGFVCTGDAGGFGCSCKWGHPNDPVYSCTGMEALCKAFGSRVECDDQWCYCGGVYKQ